MALNPLKPFWPYLRPYKRRIALALVFLTLAQVAGTSIPIVLKVAVDAVKEGLDAAGSGGGAAGLSGGVLGDIAFYAGLILGLALVQMGFQMGMRWYLNSTSRYVENDIRRAYFGHLLRLSLNYFHRTPTGDLMARASNDVDAVRMFLGFGVRMVFGAVLALGMAMVVMCAIDWKLAIYSLLPMPVMAVVMNRVSAKIHVGFRAVQEQFSKISARVQENLSGVRVVKAYVQQEAEVEAFDALSLRYHPDRYNQFRHERWGEAIYQEANILYKMMTEAYGVLADRKMRALYDQGLAQGLKRLSLEDAKNLKNAGPKSVEDLGTLDASKKFLKLAQTDIATMNWNRALQNLRFAQSMEPQNEAIAAKIQEIEAKI